MIADLTHSVLLNLFLKMIPIEGHTKTLIPVTSESQKNILFKIA